MVFPKKLNKFLKEDVLWILEKIQRKRQKELFYRNTVHGLLSCTSEIQTEFLQSNKTAVVRNLSLPLLRNKYTAVPLVLRVNIWVTT